MKLESTTGDDLFESIANDVTTQQDRVGVEAMDDIRQRIGVPVGRVKGRVIRSKRDEPPRTETGRLRNSITVDSAFTGDTAEMVIYSDTPYAPILENELNRPIFTDWLDKYLDPVLDAHVKGIEGA